MFKVAAQPRDVALRRGTEQLFILTAKIRRVFITGAVTGACYVPFWAKDATTGTGLINARSETAFEKPAFREAIEHCRCIIPVDGFYEWKNTGGRKQPYFFHLLDGQPLGFAGLWERWQGGGRIIESGAILTTEANEVLAPVHDRMPVILHPDEYQLWLEEKPEHEIIKGLMRPYPTSEMSSYPVSTRVNNPRFEGAELINRV